MGFLAHALENPEASTLEQRMNIAKIELSKLTTPEIKEKLPNNY
jgi:hypothetical protein